MWIQIADCEIPEVRWSIRRNLEGDLGKARAKDLADPSIARFFVAVFGNDDKLAWIDHPVTPEELVETVWRFFDGCREVDDDRLEIRATVTPEIQALLDQVASDIRTRSGPRFAANRGAD